MRSLLGALLLLVPIAVFAQDAPPPPADLGSPPASAQHLDDGLVTRLLAAGTGSEKPGASDVLRLRYTAWRSDGSLIGHLDAPRTIVVPVQKMLPGWREAALMMVVGEKRRSWVPASLGDGKIPVGDQFVFDTELVEIIHQPQVPEDVAATPADATITKSGLAYKVLRHGTGTSHPTARDTVVVHYSGWTTDGRRFDSSVVRGEPTEFGLRDVIRGWTEGLQLMTVGEKARFWIPAKLAYGNERGKPHGTLVFDIELLDIK
jgi:FKBP-type peptidyl-prolyl cis-trans isomerase